MKISDIKNYQYELKFDNWYEISFETYDKRINIIFNTTKLNIPKKYKDNGIDLDYSIFKCVDGNILVLNYTDSMSLLEYLQNNLIKYFGDQQIIDFKINEIG